MSCDRVTIKREQVEEIIELLEEVVGRRGPYSRDQLTHAENVINNASEKATKVTQICKELISGSKEVSV